MASWIPYKKTKLLGADGSVMGLASGKREAGGREAWMKDEKARRRKDASDEIRISFLVHVMVREC